MTGNEDYQCATERILLPVSETMTDSQGQQVVAININDARLAMLKIAKEAIFWYRTMPEGRMIPVGKIVEQFDING